MDRADFVGLTTVTLGHLPGVRCRTCAGPVERFEGSREGVWIGPCAHTEGIEIGEPLALIVWKAADGPKL